MKRANKLNRREFLELGLRTAAAAGLVSCGVGAEQLGQAASASTGPAPLSDLDAFNYSVGTQSFGAAYQFTEKPRLLETAEAIRELVQASQHKVPADG